MIPSVSWRNVNPVAALLTKRALPRRGRARHVDVAVAATAALAAAMLTGCADDPAPPGVVEPTDAYTAIITWQAEEQEPVLGADGAPQLPVIYVVAADGDTIDAGVQASVTAATADDAVVRFADDANDTFDADVDGAPVHDGGVLLAIGAMPEPAYTLDVDVNRFDAKDDYQGMALRVTATERTTVASGGEPGPRAEVTRVTPR